MSSLKDRGSPRGKFTEDTLFWLLSLSKSDPFFHLFVFVHKGECKLVSNGEPESLLKASKNYLQPTAWEEVIDAMMLDWYLAKIINVIVRGSSYWSFKDASVFGFINPKSRWAVSKLLSPSKQTHVSRKKLKKICVDEEVSLGRKVQTNHTYMTLNKWLQRTKSIWSDD